MFLTPKTIKSILNRKSITNGMMIIWALFEGSYFPDITVVLLLLDLSDSLLTQMIRTPPRVLKWGPSFTLTRVI